MVREGQGRHLIFRREAVAISFLLVIHMLVGRVPP